MYYTYILKSTKTGRFYIGYTQDLSQRLEKHNAGHSRATKSGIPWQLVWSMESESKTEALKLENALKKLKNKSILQSIVDGSYDLQKLRVDK
jgi:putative endonuclease